MQTDVLRPASTVINQGPWAINPSGTAHGVTSDDNDATFITSNGQFFCLLQSASHTPPAGHQRHRMSTVAVAEASIAGNLELNGQFDPPSGWTQGQTGQFFVTTGGDQLYGHSYSTPAGFPGGPGPITIRWTVRAIGTSTQLDVIELYCFIDNRAQPTFSPEVRDGAGVNRDAGIVSDTSRPVFVFDGPAYDGLTARTWTLEVRTDPGGVVVFSASGTGTPPNVQSDPLPNGDYEADLQISSTIRTNDAYASTVENVTFEVAFVAPASPVLTATPIASPPSIQLDWVSDTPTATAWDVDADVVTEIRRMDCNGIRTFYVEQTGIAAAMHIDRFMSLCASGPFCGETVQALQMSGGPAAQSFMNDTAPISITGDIDIRVDLSLIDWASTVAGQQTLVTKDGSYVFSLAAWTPGAARLTFGWVDTTLVSVQATAALPFGPGQRGTVRVTHDVNNGAGSRTTTFYYDIGDGWVQLGAPVVGGTAGDIDDSANPLVVGVPFFGPGISPVGSVYSMELYDGIDGTQVASPDFSDRTQWTIGDVAGATGTDSQGNLWQLAGDGAIQNACCQVVYQARYWGLVDDVVVTTGWSDIAVDSVANPNPGEAWIRGGDSGDLNVCPDESYGLARPFGVFQPIAGGMPTVITATPGGRNYTLSIPTNNEADTVTLLAILAQAIVFYQPVAQADLWLAPDSHQVNVTKVMRNRMTDVPFVAVNPQPVVDPSSFF